MRTVVSAEIIKRCPYVDEIDLGTVEIAFDGPARELHGLAAHLASYRDVAISHEDFTRAIADANPAARCVTTRWRTAGLSIECEVHA